MKTIPLDRYITYYIYSFLYSSLVPGPLDYTHILASVNNAAVDMGLKMLQVIDLAVYATVRFLGF